ncbi:non-classical arabinogalactan protein 30-like protein [Cinnamomum micranthum f. kanehirae]|uniref:Non-classical arabinogalactan protein 30-like protein n=1 Tax=Cinnamomum micranthum f. kanehirae TaxID=337451 RepID=A0A3S3MD15_9MAGN|nr:non-classical arabinogalactan protein 30-like protein [Cinnamomum micranthum f. kanehirae]
MATQQLSLFSPLLLMLLLLPFAAHGSNEASHEIKKTIDVVVEGVVYCQSCDHAGTSYLIGATPIEFGRVGVSCKDHKGRVSFYKAFTTDAYGYFYAPLQDFKMKHDYLDHPLQACTVHLHSSPHPQCNLLSNVNSGIDGSPLRYERKRLSGEKYEVVLYAAGPLAFRPSNCSPKIH